VLRETVPDAAPDAVFVNTRTGFQRQLLELALGPVRDGRLLTGYGDPLIVEPARDTSLRAEIVLAPCLPNPDLIAPRWTTDWLRAHLPARATAGKPRRLYVTRGSRRNSRRLSNEAEVWPLLERRGFTRLDPGTVGVQEQIDHFAAAEVVVAPHGAGLSNLVFAPPGVRVLELFHPRYVNPCFWTIADNVGADYRYLVCGRDTRPPGAPMHGVLSDIVVEPERLQRALDALL
jgi:capsular polysaccharide biosynthesis protein